MPSTPHATQAPPTSIIFATSPSAATPAPDTVALAAPASPVSTAQPTTSPAPPTPSAPPESQPTLPVTFTAATTTASTAAAVAPAAPPGPAAATAAATTAAAAPPGPAAAAAAATTADAVTAAPAGPAAAAVAASVMYAAPAPSIAAHHAFTNPVAPAARSIDGANRHSPHPQQDSEPRDKIALLLGRRIARDVVSTHDLTWDAAGVEHLAKLRTQYKEACEDAAAGLRRLIFTQDHIQAASNAIAQSTQVYKGMMPKPGHMAPLASRELQQWLTTDYTAPACAMRCMHAVHDVSAPVHSQLSQG